MKARKIVEKRIRYQCHVSTLNSYSIHDVIPKGLRINVEPATSDIPSDLTAMLAECLHGASRQLLDIVIEHDSFQLQYLLSEEQKFTERKSLTPSEVGLFRKIRTRQRAQ